MLRDTLNSSSIEVKIVEVGPRDGLQNEEKELSTQDKVRLIQSLVTTGLKDIEITSFVSPKWIPQLADGAEVARSVKLPLNVNAYALVPNLKGYERAISSGMKNIALFLSATESHSKKNINKSIDEAVDSLTEVAKKATADGISMRAYVSVVFVCPYEGPVKAESVEKLVSQLLAMGVNEISLGDTIGAATPNQVVDIVKRVEKQVSLKKIALHMHDTRGTALANVLAGLESGVTTFDASIGGLGGCPYAPGASGNLATEDLVYMLSGMGVKTGVDLEKLVDSGELAQNLLGRKLPGRYLQAALASRAKAAEKATRTA
jgi:hydroxymethylglutaryl-CoA lyase